MNQLYSLKNKTIFFATTLTLLMVSCNQNQGIDTTKINNEPSTNNAEVKRNTDIIKTPIQKVTLEDFDPSSLKEISHNIPEGIKYEGAIKNAYTWNDKNGENILLNYIYSTEKYNKKEGDTYLTAIAYSKHYVNTGKGYYLMFENIDDITDCMFDLVLEYLSIPVIEDSDHNGFAEVTVCLRKTCVSDISPAYLDVIVHENKTSYALRGLEYLALYDDDEIPLDFQYNESVYIESTDAEEDYIEVGSGRYHNNDDFLDAPKSFFLTAEKVWKANIFRLVEY